MAINYCLYSIAKIIIKTRICMKKSHAYTFLQSCIFKNSYNRMGKALGLYV